MDPTTLPYNVETLTPMMQQWHECKIQAKEALLLFRMGDFYEAFYDDAKILSDICSLTLTKRQEIPMSGLPQQMLEVYLERLVMKGLLVAVAEQISDPKEGKGLVKRAIVRRASPATYISQTLFDAKTNHYFASYHRLNCSYGLAFIDLSTQEVLSLEVENKKELLDQIDKKKPKELLVSRKEALKDPSLLEEIKTLCPLRITEKSDHLFEHEAAFRTIKNHFKVQGIDGFGLRGMNGAIVAIGALLAYLKDELCLDLSHVEKIQKEESLEGLIIDRTTDRHLEISTTLLSFLDRTLTPMGGRLFKKWIQLPLTDLISIFQRQEAIKDFLTHYPITCQIKQKFQGMKDLERLILKIGSPSVQPKDLALLVQSLKPLLHLSNLSIHFTSSLLSHLFSPLFNPEELICLIEQTLTPDSALKGFEERLFQKGVDEELDSLFELKENGQSWVLQYQEQLKETTNIKTLKVSFTRAFGYYVEVSRSQSEKVPSTFIRRQTLVNAERFITEELKQYEEKMLNAEAMIYDIQNRLFKELIQKILFFLNSIRQLSQSIAHIDALLSLSTIAEKEGYCCPTLDEANGLEIIEGRHPVIETLLPPHTFEPNDLHLNEEKRLALITGPNMAGKSTYIRQSALIILMAQIGSFVPAKKAHIGLVDRIFSRIGASDDLMRGLSTFMVEMVETAQILHHLTDRSFVILDEIGRGTSTFDGISIAWAVADHLLHAKKGVKTLFATHYTELTEIGKRAQGAFNLQVLVKEEATTIHFLYKIAEGIADKSYGIHVAKLAGLPPTLIKKAEEMLKVLEKSKTSSSKQDKNREGKQIVLFELV